MKPRTASTVTDLKNTCLIVTAILAFFFLLLLHKYVQGGDCTMALQLLDPYVRTNYELVVESGRIQDDWEICGTTSLPVQDENRQNTIFDPISMECINCHDGTVAQAVDYRFEKTETHEGTSLVTLLASHPIGVDFTKFSCNNKFNHWRSLPPEIVLMNGKIGCASCHNLLGNRYLYLSVDMAGSGLCFTCHRK